MKVNSLNIRNTVQIKHTPVHNPELAFVQDYVDFTVNAVVSTVDGHRIILIQFLYLDVSIVIEEVDLGDEESSVTVRYTKHSTPTVEIYKDESFFFDFTNNVYFPKDEVITAINNQLMKDYEFVVFPDIDYNSICNF